MNNKSTRPGRRGRGHGTDRGRIYYAVWGLGFVGLIAFPIWLEVLGIWVDRIPLYPSAFSGDAKSQFELAYTYRSPQHKFVGNSFETAFYWDLEAAEQGHVGAMYHVAQAYMSGRGTIKNLKTAEAWYRKLSELGEEPAQKMVDEIERRRAARIR